MSINRLGWSRPLSYKSLSCHFSGLEHQITHVYSKTQNDTGTTAFAKALKASLMNAIYFPLLFPGSGVIRSDSLTQLERIEYFCELTRRVFRRTLGHTGAHRGNLPSLYFLRSFLWTFFTTPDNFSCSLLSGVSSGIGT